MFSLILSLLLLMHHPHTQPQKRNAGERKRTAGERKRTAGERKRTAGEQKRTAGEQKRTAGEQKSPDHGGKRTSCGARDLLLSR